MYSELTLRGADGVNLHAVSAGSGPLILFLHGFPEFWRAWHRQLDAFSSDYQAVALDLRGHNESDKPAGATNYALPRIVDDIRSVLAILSPKQPSVLVGHDWGGIAGWALARQNPELLHRFVAINAPHPVLFYRELKHNPAQALASSYAGFIQLRGLAEAALRAFDFWALRRMVFGTSTKPMAFSRELRDAYRESWRKPGAISAGLNYYRNVGALVRMLNPASSWRIEVPTLLLWGERDPVLLQGNLVGLDEFVPQLAVRRHSAATHWIVHEEPQWVNQAIRNFIASG